MSLWLKQSTSVVISFGPFLLNTDGVTLVTNLVGTGANQTENTSTGIRISKNGGAFAARHATATASTYDAFGNYLVTLDATDTNTLGILRVQFANGAAFCPVWTDFEIVAANIYDSLIGGGDVLDVSAIQILGVAISSPATAGILDVNVKNVANAAINALVSGRVDASVGAMAANVLTASAINADAITDAKVASDVTIASVTGAVGSVTAGVTVTTNNDKTGYGLSAAAVQAIWDALTSALTTAGSIGKWIVDKLDVVLSTRLASSSYTAPLDATGVRSAVGLASANLDTQLGAIDDYIDTEVGAIKAKTDQLTFTVANQVDSNVVDWKGATAPAMTGDAFARLGAPAGASVSADIAAVKSDTAAIKTKTDNLPIDPADASDIATATGAILTDTAAIKAKTDNLPASPAATGDIPTSADISSSVWDALVADHVADGSMGKTIKNGLLDNPVRMFAVVISGAGTTEANGRYTFRGISGGKAYFTKEGEVDSDIVSSVSWGDGGVGAGVTWNVYSSAGAVLYADTSGQDSQFPWLSEVAWDIATGTTPRPTSSAVLAVPDVPTTEQIADAVWDEDIVSAHQTDDTAGKKLSRSLILYEGS